MLWAPLAELDFELKLDLDDLGLDLRAGRCCSGGDNRNLDSFLRMELLTR